MIRICKFLFVVLLLTQTIFIGFGFGQTKLSPVLSHLLFDPDSSGLELANRSAFFSLQKISVDRILVPCLIYKSPGSDLRAKVSLFGGTIGTDLNNWCTAYLPLDQITSLATETVISYIDVAPRAEIKLDKSVVAIRANLVQEGQTPLSQAYQGENVVVGVVDSGIDIAHPDFYKADGSCRIQNLWDQTAGGSPPVGFTYGAEWSRQNITAGICSEVDNGESMGHGTHVTGIAAGNGRAIGKYAGVAPKSDIIVVKTDFSFAHIIDGIQYVFDQAGEKPAVVNLSLATHQGSHDDSSPVAQIMNEMVAPGRIIVAAASNEGDKAIHVGYQVSASKVHGSGFSEPDNSQNYIDMDLWYANSGSISYAIGGLDANRNWLTQTGWVAPGQGITRVKFQANGKIYGLVTIDATEINNPNNHQRHVYIEISNDHKKYDFSASAITWVLLTKGTGYFDGWLYDNSSVFDNFTGQVASVQLIAGDNHSTIGIPGTASAVITVGAYTAKTIWTAANGNTYQVSATLDDRAIFSSIGPTQDNRIKPDIMAPGFVIASALSKDTDVLTSTPARVMPGEKHWVIQGTSMAAPHVTGAIALLLQQNPGLSPEDLLSLLQENAIRDAYTGTTPNDYWGMGKLDVFAAMVALATAVPDAATEPQPLDWWLGQNYPNPWHADLARTGATVTIPFYISPSDEADLTIYDLLGREIRRFRIQSTQISDQSTVSWDGCDEQGRSVSAGVYFYRLHAGNKMQTRKMLIVP